VTSYNYRVSCFTEIHVALLKLFYIQTDTHTSLCDTTLSRNITGSYQYTHWCIKVVEDTV